jgi:hypothetical protein
MSVIASMTGSTSLIDESTTDLTTGMLKKLNKEQAHCLPTGWKLVCKTAFSAPISHHQTRSVDNHVGTNPRKKSALVSNVRRLTSEHMQIWLLNSQVVINHVLRNVHCSNANNVQLREDEFIAERRTATSTLSW